MTGESADETAAPGGPAVARPAARELPDRSRSGEQAPAFAPVVIAACDRPQSAVADSEGECARCHRDRDRRHNLARHRPGHD